MEKQFKQKQGNFMYILNSLYQEVKIKMIYISKIERSFLKMLSLNKMTQSIMQIGLKKYQ